MEYDLRLKLASNIQVVGPSQSGKTTFVESLITNKHLMFDTIPKRIVWCSSTNVIASKLKDNIKYVNGLPKLDIIKPYDLIILDDLFLEASESKDISALFTKYSHHKPCCIVFLTQNMFYQSKQQRNRSLNTHYLVLFKNPRDTLLIRTLAIQMGCKDLVAIFNDATVNAHSYIFLDFHQETQNELRIRSNILPHEYPPIVYISNK